MVLVVIVSIIAASLADLGCGGPKWSLKVSGIRPVRLRSPFPYGRGLRNGCVDSAWLMEGVPAQAIEKAHPTLQGWSSGVAVSAGGSSNHPDFTWWSRLPVRTNRASGSAVTRTASRSWPAGGALRAWDRPGGLMPQGFSRAGMCAPFVRHRILPTNFLFGLRVALHSQCNRSVSAVLLNNVYSK